MEEQTIIQPSKPRVWDTTRVILFAVSALLLFLFSLDLMVASFQHLGRGMTELIVSTTASPLTALFIGLLLTAMMQSSSATTALTVALVGSGSLALESAVPVILGANVGTTITSTIVSLGFLKRKKELKRAVSAGTYHFFFNALTLLLVFPLEYYNGFLSTTSRFIASAFTKQERSDDSSGTITSWLDPMVNYLVQIIPAALLFVCGFLLVFGSILLFRKFISQVLNARSPQAFGRFFFQSASKSFLWGILTTAAIRSSTITTSVVVPIVAKKIATLKQGAAFIMGANVGTTITAFLAALLYSDSVSARSIALAHLLFNVIGVLLFFPIPALRVLPVRLSQSLGKAAAKQRSVGFAFLFLAFFLIPFLVIFLNQGK